MDKEQLQGMVKSHYEGVFNIRWGETWYTDVLTPLVLSATKNDEIRKEDSITPLNNDAWKPYELIIETQIGLALVLCQSYLNNVVSQVQNFHNDYHVLFEKDLAEFSINRRDLFKLGNPFYKKTEHTFIEAIDHLANYFKHHQEWMGRTELLQNNAKRTADVVEEFGLDLRLSLWFSRNLTNAVKPFGVNELNELPKILTIVDDWKKEIGNRYKSKKLFI